MQSANHIQALQPSFIREILSAASGSGVTSLAGGLPATELFPMALLSDAMTSISGDNAIFQYHETRGYPLLVDYLANEYGLKHQDLMICTGAQQAIDLLARVYISPGDKVVVEAPCYSGAMQAFDLAQADICAVSQKINGPDLECLETIFASGGVKFFYAVPDFNNPTGSCWSLGTRRQVAELCVQYQISLIEDAPYRELRFSGQPLPMVSEFCPDIAFVLRSFSKIAAPGLRVACITGPEKWIEPLIKVKQITDLHTSTLSQAVMLYVLQHSLFSDHLDNLRTQYKSRYEAMVDAIVRSVSIEYHLNDTQGGMFIWLRLPGRDTMAISKAALKEGVAVVPGDVFYRARSNEEKALRLNFSHTDEANICRAINTLAKVINKH